LEDPPRPACGRPGRVRRYAAASHIRTRVACGRVPAYPSAARSAARRNRRRLQASRCRD